MYQHALFPHGCNFIHHKISSYLTPRLKIKAIFNNLIKHLCHAARDNDQLILIKAYTKRLLHRGGDYAQDGDYEFFSSNNFNWNIDDYVSVSLTGECFNNEHLPRYLEELRKVVLDGGFNFALQTPFMHLEVNIEYLYPRPKTRPTIGAEFIEPFIPIICDYVRYFYGIWGLIDAQPAAAADTDVARAMEPPFHNLCIYAGIAAINKGLKQDAENLGFLTEYWYYGRIYTAFNLGQRYVSLYLEEQR